MTGGAVRRIVPWVLGVSMLAALIAPGAGMAVIAPGVAWKISVVAQPTNLPLTGQGQAQYVLVLTNTGSVASSGPITLTDTLPSGVAVSEAIDGSGGVFEGSGWECSVGGAGANVIVTCIYGGSVPALGQSPVITIPVSVASAGMLTNEVAVSGGGGLDAAASRTTEAGSPPAPFELLDFSSQASDVSGGPDTQAGDHPYALTATLDFSQKEVEGSPTGPVQFPKAMDIDLPPGLIGNPQAVSQCKIVEVFAKTCPASSRIGTLFLNFNQGLFVHGGQYPIYNVVPEHGYPAEFVFYALGINQPGFMYGSVRTGSDYGLHLSVPDIPRAASAANIIATFYGDPQSLDGAGNSSRAFFTNPSECSGLPLVTKVEAVSWEEPNRRVKAETQALPISGCNFLQFQPAIAITPNTTLADEPTGYTFDLKIPQSQTAGLEGLATPDLKDATVTLPQGVSISPGAADGLVGCPAEGPEGINLTSPGAGHCPLASQVGTAEAHTPLLAEQAQGHVYVAMPNCGGENQEPCGAAAAVNGNLFGLYLELEVSGVVIKQHGTVSVDPGTGQITTSFKDAPQLPFDDLKLTLKDGPRAPLSNPQACGDALTTSDITPWSTPQTPDATPSWLFTVTGCGGPQFAPSFEAGAVNSAGGAFTSFTTTFGRTDRQENLAAIQAHLPAGLLAMISHVTLCGEPQASRGDCPADSRIGTANAAAGAGSHPFWTSGPVYLTGPYKGAPFGLSIPISAKAGPFNLGTVLTRAMLNVDPVTAAATITSDPLPQLLDGVPLRVQTVNVTVDRSQFIFNPTNCEAKQVTATVLSAQNSSAQVSSPFAAGGCKNLPFNPKFTVSTGGKTTKAGGASLTVRVAERSGEANIQRVDLRLPVALPARLTTLQKACTAAQFEVNPAGCPAASVIGTAKAITPVLKVPLVGPAYLVSHGGAAFPDVEFVLQADERGGGVQIVLDGKTQIKKGITYSRFESVPDAPISSFETVLPQGPHSALGTNLPAKAKGSLCGRRLTMPTTLTGQNGAVMKQNTKISITGCPRAKKAKKAKQAKGTSKRRKGGR